MASTMITTATVSPAFLTGSLIGQKNPLRATEFSANAYFPKRNRSMCSVRASSRDSQQPRVLKAALIAVAAATAVGLGSGDFSVFAASGPGIPGAERTAQKADELLKAADKLTTNDSPARFGPGRSPGDETSKLAQQAGSGVQGGLQGAQAKVESDVGSAVEQAKDTASDAASKVDSGSGSGFFSSLKSGLEGLTGSLPNAEAVKEGANQLGEQTKQNLPGQ